jgi:hypothetical protein
MVNTRDHIIAEGVGGRRLAGMYRKKFLSNFFFLSHAFFRRSSWRDFSPAFWRGWCARFSDGRGFIRRKTFCVLPSRRRTYCSAILVGCLVADSCAYYPKASSCTSPLPWNITEPNPLADSQGVNSATLRP